jgi:hypothetical protein
MPSIPEPDFTAPRKREREQIATLEADWPGWEVWVVHRVYGGPVWCARRHDDHKRVLNAASPAELDQRLDSKRG